MGGDFGQRRLGLGARGGEARRHFLLVLDLLLQPRQHAADAMTFDAWLKTPAGQLWLDWEEEQYEEEHGLSTWEGW